MATTNGQTSDCCIWSTITGLSGGASAKNNMLSFCKGNLSEMAQGKDGHGSPWARHREASSTGTLFSAYVFSGPTGVDRNYGQPNYAGKFADFIEENGLGTVTRSPVVKNTTYHGGRPGQVFIWAPNEKAVVAWYRDQIKPKEAQGKDPKKG